MAFDALSTTNPCSLLNNTDYPSIWISATATNPYAHIATNGVTRSFKEVLGTQALTSLTLISPNANTASKLIRYMSGATTSQLGQILLGSSSSRETIIDTFIIESAKGIGKQAYRTNYGPHTSTNQNGLRDIDIWNTADVDLTTGQPTNPTSIIGKLLQQRYLLSLPDIYFPAQLQSMPNPPTPGDSSLIYLYKVQQESRLSSDQQTRVTELETRNLKFFSAFYVEYCFYRTRYVWLLKKYFDIYKTTDANYTNILSGSPELNLFAGNGTAQNQYTGASLSRQDFLKGIAYHLAILNTRLNDMRRILSAINRYYQEIFRTIQANINDTSLVGSNSDLVKTINALNTSAIDSKNYLSEAEFRKGVLEYNAQKNRYANNLLGLYAFLNISALAIIVHLYQS
jgi:hypothetical protein